MGTKSNPGDFDCYEAAEPDEPMFILLARDDSAPDLVLAWAERREREVRTGECPKGDLKKVAEARACAQAMREWQINRPAASPVLDYDGTFKGKKFVEVGKNRPRTVEVRTDGIYHVGTRVVDGRGKGKLLQIYRKHLIDSKRWKLVD